MTTQLEKLPSDVLIYMALNLDMPEILNLCNISDKINSILCNNERFWMNKVIKDYPKIFNSNTQFLYGKTYKEIYKQLSKEYITIDIEYNIEYTDGFYIQDTISLYHQIKISTLVPLDEIKSMIYDIIMSFNQYIFIEGNYEIYVDRVMTCDAEEISQDCFNNITHDTTDIMINLKSYEPIDPTLEQVYQYSLESYVNEFTDQYESKY